MKKITKILALFLFMTFFAAGRACAVDTVNLPTETLTGKFYSITEGYIILDQKGVKKSFVRLENQNDIYRDFISYSTSPFSRNYESTACKVVFLDTWLVKFKLPNTSVIEIPRYRIKDLEININ